MLFSPADILLPRDVDMTRWAVVACDQFTSQPSYWAQADMLVGDAPSALRLILPECKLERPDVDDAIDTLHRTMEQYVKENRFTTHTNALFYLERTLLDGRVRRGLVGKIDLEDYDYRPGSDSLIRATEGTVLDRLPPRIAVRRGASLELPHVMLLMDDPERSVIEPLAPRNTAPLYDFPLMASGGAVAAWQLDGDETAAVLSAIGQLGDPARLARLYGAGQRPPLLFAVGDGNHSLAAAKAYYETLKTTLPPEAAAAHPARYALVELENLHDDGLTFESIERVVFDVDPADLLAALVAYYPGAQFGAGAGHSLPFFHAGGEGVVTVPNPPTQLAVGTLQAFLDDYVASHGGKIDYIHGAAAARSLASAAGSIAFFLPAMPKEALFPAVQHDGALPRKTFSMGHAEEKRYYVEARRIV